MGGADYQYDGEGRRVQQTVSSVVTKYLLDIQPSLAVVLSQDVGGSVSRFVHAPRGIHARKDASSAWHWTVQDGLSTVRMETDNSVGVEGSQNLDPFGNLIGSVNGTIGTPFGFTGELVDGSGLLDLRARRYNAGIGVFASLDPFEGSSDDSMSLNGYGYVAGNPINMVDPSGMIYETPDMFAGCVIKLRDISENDPCGMYPGWSYMGNDVRNGEIVPICENERTLSPDSMMPLAHLNTWWTGLSTTEREIKKALAATNLGRCRGNAPFQHIPQNTFTFVSGWILSNKTSIKEISARVRVQPSLVAGILASEMLFDYGWTDALSDYLLLNKFSPNQGYGYANPHLTTRNRANYYVRQLVIEGGASAVEDISGSSEWTKRRLTTAEGAIAAAAVVARWLVDPFKGLVDLSYSSADPHRDYANAIYQSALPLTPEEMAVIWSGYRAGVEGLSPYPPIGENLGFQSVQQWRSEVSDFGDFPCNGQISLPVMKYMSNLFL